jgi:hypothetical protein
MASLGKNARKRLTRKETVESQKIEWDSDTYSDDCSSDEEDTLDDDFYLCNWELDIIYEYGRPAFEKYKIMNQYNIGQLTKAFRKATKKLHKKHFNLKNFSPLSGIEDKKEQDDAIGPESLIDQIVFQV